MPRRLAFLALVAFCGLLGTQGMAEVLPQHGAGLAERGLLVLFGILFAWISAGFWTGVMGAGVMLFGHGRSPLMRARMETLRVYGAALAPMSAWQVLQGIETLPLRMERHCANALAVARFLQAHRQVSWVQYPGLPDHPDHALVARQMRAFDGVPGASGLLAFGVKGGLAAGVRFIEAAQMMSHLANIGDTRTLVIHPASTTHRQLDEAQQRAAGVEQDMVRISVGLEHIDDILWDIDQALAASAG